MRNRRPVPARSVPRAPGSISVSRAVPRRQRDPDANDKSVALIRDIPLPGRLLGEGIREQEGDAAYDLIERNCGTDGGTRQPAYGARLRRQRGAAARAGDPALADAHAALLATDGRR